MKVTTLLLVLMILSSPAAYGQDDAAVAQEAVSQTDLVGTSYTLCIPRDGYQPGDRETCFEYLLRENGQAIHMFWIDRLDTGRIENQSISHRAWILNGDQVIIQGEHLRYGKESIFYYDVHEILANGDLLWVRREADKDGGTQIQDLTGDARELRQLIKDDRKGAEKFRAQMERDSRWYRPVAKDWDPEAYWDEVVSEYPARYLRGS